jgi:hypothetical protein
LRRISNPAGLDISVLRTGSLFAIEHRTGSGSILVSQVLGAPLDGGIARLLLRVGARGRPLSRRLVRARMWP